MARRRFDSASADAVYRRLGTSQYENTESSLSPGNDYLVTLGAWGPEKNTKILGSKFVQRQTFAHELGHTLGLRHGGIDHIGELVDPNSGFLSQFFSPTYKSLMNYAYQTNERVEITGRPVVTDYSRQGDPIFVDWDNLQFNITDYFTQIGNSFLLGRAGAPFGLTPEISTRDQEFQSGAIDSEGPTVSVVAPINATAFPLGSDVTVVVTATDNVRVDLVEVEFDIDGDGTTQGPGEIVEATQTGASTFEATFFNIRGSVGERVITVVAEDPSENPGIVNTSIFVVSGTPVSVPNVVGQTQAAATTAITTAGLVLGTVTTQSSSIVPSGSVISQNPTAGSSVAAGSAVNLVVSSGPAPVSVPNVVGQTQAAATTAITTAGLVLGTVTTQSSSIVPSGSVISQNPTAGSSVAAGSAVNLVVSSGPAPVSVPGDLNGDSLVDCADVEIVKNAMGRRQGQKGYDARADINRDGRINGQDLSFVMQRFHDFARQNGKSGNLACRSK